MAAKTRQQQQHRETNLKSVMAETLVYDLLTEAGSEVYRIGHRATLPATLAIEDALSSDARIGGKLKSIPDFLVIDSKGAPHLVEVKFRWHPSGHENDIKKLKSLGELWEESLIVFVNCSEKPYFRISHAPFVSKNGRIMTAPLSSFAKFQITEQLVERFDELVVKYLTPTLFPQREIG